MPSKRMKVYAHDIWNNTNVHVPAKTPVTISYIPPARWITHPDKHCPVDGDGFYEPGGDYYMTPGANIGGLLALIKKGGQEWGAFIGNQGHITAPFSGDLLLAANDECAWKGRDGYDDNAGYIEVEISW